jgi:hypothetical protein
MISGNSRFFYSSIFLVFLALVLSGCGANYTTPGGSVPLADLAETDINELLTTQPTARFPARIAVARVQAPGYESHRTTSFGTGRYSVVTTRDVESDESFDRLAAMPMVAGFGPLNRILLPTELESIQALRTAAARLKADVLLIYTFDTAFRVGEQHVAPLNVIALGLLPNKEVAVTTTASAALFDVRTEFLYGLAEATGRESRYASVWRSSDAVDELRVATERKAFEALVPEIEAAWAGIVAEHAGGTAGAAAGGGALAGPS